MGGWPWSLVAAQGIGHAIATALAEAGAVVTATDICDQSSLSDRIRTRSHDVTDNGRWGEIIHEIETDHGQLDILVNRLFTVEGVVLVGASVTG